MTSGVLVKSEIEDRVRIFREALGFEGFNDSDLQKIAEVSFLKHYSKGEIIFHQNEPCRFFYIVAKGLVKVFIYSYTGARITYLLAERGEPLNLVGPFTGEPRSLFAEAMIDSAVIHVKREDFVNFAFQHPSLVINIISILGKAIDSANSRIIDMMEKRVKQRLLRVLYTLYRKFGDTIELTSNELADLAATTTETTLRVMAQLRKAGIINSRRGKVTILKPEKLKPPVDSEEAFWL